MVFTSLGAYRRTVTTSLLPATLTGFGSGASLIVAIGAQNAYVLRQGVTRQRVALVVLICIASDAILIAAGVAGVGAVVDRAPLFVDAVRWAGALFLTGYAVLAARRALHPQALDGAEATTQTEKLRGVALTALALTWLNPHVYLDTVVLLGSLAVAQGDPGRWAFGAGAVTASALWFSLIGFGAHALRPLRRRPRAWRFLDAAVALQMLVVAALLVRP